MQSIFFGMSERDIDCTKVIFSTEARKKLFKGLENVASAVGCTLGPRGKCVLLQLPDNPVPVSTKDGVTVSKAVKPRDPVERMGAFLIREAASQTNDTAGDGTTTATVLTHAMVKSGLKLLEAGYTSKELCSGIEIATQAVVGQVRDVSKKLTTTEEISQIATISANGDKNVGDIIADAMSRVGHDGIITVEDAKGTTTSLDVVEGMQVDRGYLSPYFVTNSEKMNVVYGDARVLLCDHKLNSIRDLLPILEKTLQTKTPLLIVADEVEGEALQGLVVNRVNANLPVVAIKAPGYGQSRDDFLRDMAALTGAKIASASTGLKVSDVKMTDLGTLKKVVVDAKSTTLVASGVTKDAVEKHVADLKEQMRDVTKTFDDLKMLRTRIAKLASGVAVIKVGGATEVEMVERKYRIEDALNATRAAVEEGIVAGGGTELFNVWMSTTKGGRTLDELSPGERIVMDSCTAPVRKIAENAGKSPDVVVADLVRAKRKNDRNLGYDASTDTYVDMMVAGIIDPALVTMTALKNASSVASTFLSLDAVIVADDSDK